MSTDKYMPPNTRDDSRHGIIKSTTIISSGTLSSRILGFIRDIVIAKLLGTASAADSFFVAFRIPNLFRDLVGEGATNSALVPVFSEYEAKQDKKELWQFISVFLVLSMVVLSAITLLGIVFAPVIVRLIAPGFIIEPEKLENTIWLTRLMFPYLIFIGLTAYSMGILYTFRSFVSPAFSPCLLNLSMIIAALIAVKFHVDPILCLAVSVLIGGVAQLAVQIPPLFRNGMKLQRPKNLSHPGVRQVGRLLVPRIFGSAVYQMNVFVDTFCASLSVIVGAGGIAAIYYANRIIQFPMGLFSVSLASAILPSMSGFAVRRDFDELKKTLAFSLENTFLIMLPTMVFIMILSVPIIRIFFERGVFDAYSTQVTSLALFFYTLGLVGFGGAKIMVTTFHSLQDTRTPAVIGFVCLLINAVLNFVLMFPLKIGGIALASSVSSTVNFLILFSIMNKRLGGIDAGLMHYFLRICLATAVMSVAVFGVWELLTVCPEMPRLLCAIAAGFFVFGFACLFLKIRQVEKSVQWILKKN